MIGDYRLRENKTIKLTRVHLQSAKNYDTLGICRQYIGRITATDR